MAGTSSKVKAQEYHDKLKAELRWLKESSHKRSVKDDKSHLRWLAPYLRNYNLNEINRDIIEDIANKKEQTGVSLTTVNRMLEILRAILRKEHSEWEWIDKCPSVRMRHVESRRIRWLSVNEANRLLKELPPHLHDMAAFSLATGQGF